MRQILAEALGLVMMMVLVSAAAIIIAMMIMAAITIPMVMMQIRGGETVFYRAKRLHHAVIRILHRGNKDGCKIISRLIQTGTAVVTDLVRIQIAAQAFPTLGTEPIIEHTFFLFHDFLQNICFLFPEHVL